MKKQCIVGILVAGLLLVGAWPSDGAAQQSADPARLQKIRKLIELEGVRTSLLQAQDHLLALLRQQAPQVPDKFLESVTKEIAEPHLNDVVDKIAAVYDKHLTDQEVNELIKFYDTPIGQGIAAKVPKITEEISVLSATWGDDISRKVMEKLLKEAAGKKRPAK